MRNVKIYVCLWQTLIILMWPCTVDRLLRSTCPDLDTGASRDVQLFIICLFSRNVPFHFQGDVSLCQSSWVFTTCNNKNIYGQLNFVVDVQGVHNGWCVCMDQMRVCFLCVVFDCDPNPNISLILQTIFFGHIAVQGFFTSNISMLFYLISVPVQFYKKCVNYLFENDFYTYMYTDFVME